MSTDLDYRVSSFSAVTLWICYLILLLTYSILAEDFSNFGTSLCCEGVLC